MAKLKKRKDGYYCAWYKGKQFLAKTAPEAEAKRNKYKYECEHGIEQVKPKTVIEFAEEWLPVAKANVSPNTYNQYATTIDILTSVIGNKYLSAVTPSDIKKVWVLFVGKSQSYINKAVFLYKAMFQAAIDNGYCRTNPIVSPSSKPHKGTKGTHRCLTDEEIRLIETVPHRCRNAAMFMLKAGLRRGEVLALHKQNIVNDRICIVSAVKFVKNRPEIGKTKNESSERTVPLFAPLKPVADSIDGYVLPDAKGNVCSETAFNRVWQSYMHTLSMNAGHTISFRPHDLRHTFVTVCRNKNIDIRTVMLWCGHSSERMILEIYDHVSEEREQRMIEMMN